MESTSIYPLYRLLPRGEKGLTVCVSSLALDGRGPKVLCLDRLTEANYRGLKRFFYACNNAIEIRGDFIIPETD